MSENIYGHVVTQKAMTGPCSRVRPRKRARKVLLRANPFSTRDIKTYKVINFNENFFIQNVECIGLFVTEFG